MEDKDHWYEIPQLKSQIFEKKETNVDSSVPKGVSLLFKSCLPDWSTYLHGTLLKTSQHKSPDTLSQVSQMRLK